MYIARDSLRETGRMWIAIGMGGTALIHADAAVRWPWAHARRAGDRGHGSEVNVDIDTDRFDVAVDCVRFYRRHVARHGAGRPAAAAAAAAPH